MNSTIDLIELLIMRSLILRNTVHSFSLFNSRLTSISFCMSTTRLQSDRATTSERFLNALSRRSASNPMGMPNTETTLQFLFLAHLMTSLIMPVPTAPPRIRNGTTMRFPSRAYSISLRSSFGIVENLSERTSKWWPNSFWASSYCSQGFLSLESMMSKAFFAAPPHTMTATSSSMEHHMGYP